MLLHEHRQKNLPPSHTGTINGVPSEAGNNKEGKDFTLYFIRSMSGFRRQR